MKFTDSRNMGILKFLTKSVLALLALVVILLAGFRAHAWWVEDQSVVALVPPNGQFIETAEGKIHISVWGDDDGQPLLFTHGMAAWGGLWTETAEHLAERGYRVIAVDQPPFGFSERADRDHSRSKQAERIKALTDALALEDYVLIGHSYGGGIALETALRYPEGIRALILACPVVGVSETDPIEANPVPPPLRSEILGQALVSATVTNPLLTGILTKQFMHRKDALTDDHIAILQRPMTLKGNTPEMVTWLRQFLAGDPKAVSRRPDALRAIQVPVSFIWGENDTVTPIAQGEELATFLAPKHFERLPEIGHMPQLEAPELFNETLTNLLAERDWQER